jgi:hypothetical protein
MRRFLYITILSVFSLSLVTCPPDESIDSCCSFTFLYLPQAVLFDIKAVNETEKPVDIKIRHKYFYLFDSGRKEDTSDWSSSYNIKNGETASIGTEQAKRWDANSSWYDEGFVLLGEDSEYHKARYLLWFYSSFEINVVTNTKTFNIPGYTYNSDFTDQLKRKSYGLIISAGRSCTLELNGHKEDLNNKYSFCPCGGCPCDTPNCSYNPPKIPPGIPFGFSLPMNLTIKSDGTYKLEFGDIQAN